MATGRNQLLGIGAETTWGTAVAADTFFNATENFTEERTRLREAMTFGTRSMQPADAGRLRITGGFSGAHARPGNIGEVFRAAMGAPTTSGAGPYTHVYDDSSLVDFATGVALPPYTLVAQRNGSGEVHGYAGGVLNSMTLQQNADDALELSTDWIAKSVDPATTQPTLVLETNPRFIFNNLVVQRNAVNFDYFRDITITFNNNLETEETLNASDQVSAIEFGDSSYTIEGTFSSRDFTLYDDFAAMTTEDFTFTWTNGTNVLLITVPQLNFDAVSAPISGSGILTAQFSATMEFNSVAGYSCEISLTNDVVSY